MRSVGFLLHLPKGAVAASVVRNGCKPVIAEGQNALPRCAEVVPGHGYAFLRRWGGLALVCL